MVQLPRHTAHDEVPKITIHQLKRLMDTDADLMILDGQRKNVYDQSHIKGAVSFPWKQQITAIDARYLPRDKMIVVYCDCGPKDTDSSDIAAQLGTLGFSDIKVLTHPSVKGWAEAGYPMEP